MTSRNETIMSESNNPVMQQPQHQISKTAAKGILGAILAMTRGEGYQPNQRRKGKHGGRNPGAFGKRGFGEQR